MNTLTKQVAEAKHLDVRIADDQIESILVTGDGPWYTVVAPPFYVDQIDLGDRIFVENGIIIKGMNSMRTRWLIQRIGPGVTPELIAQRLEDYEDVAVAISGDLISLSFEERYDVDAIATVLQRGKDAGEWLFWRMR